MDEKLNLSDWLSCSRYQICCFSEKDNGQIESARNNLRGVFKSLEIEGKLVFCQKTKRAKLSKQLAAQDQFDICAVDGLVLDFLNGLTITAIDLLWIQSIVRLCAKKNIPCLLLLMTVDYPGLDEYLGEASNVFSHYPDGVRDFLKALRAVKTRKKLSYLEYEFGRAYDLAQELFRG